MSSARELAVNNIHKAQRKYKKYYDRGTTPHRFKIGDWVFVKFPQEESSRFRKLFKPWHGPYRIVACDDPDVTVIQLYFPQKPHSTGMAATVTVLVEF